MIIFHPSGLLLEKPRFREKRTTYGHRQDQVTAGLPASDACSAHLILHPLPPVPPPQTCDNWARVSWRSIWGAWSPHDTCSESISSTSPGATSIWKHLWEGKPLWGIEKPQHLPFGSLHSWPQLQQNYCQFLAISKKCSAWKTRKRGKVKRAPV